MELSSETPGESGVVGRLARRTRSGNRVWPDTIKGRAVFESMKPGARVCDVAQRYGIRAQQLTTWRGQARKGQIALVADEAPDFVTIEVSDPASAGGIWRLSTFRLARLRFALMRMRRRHALRRSRPRSSVAHDYSGAGTADRACSASCRFPVRARRAGRSRAEHARARSTLRSDRCVSFEARGPVEDFAMGRHGACFDLQAPRRRPFRVAADQRRRSASDANAVRNFVRRTELEAYRRTDRRDADCGEQTHERTGSDRRICFVRRFADGSLWICRRQLSIPPVSQRFRPICAGCSTHRKRCSKPNAGAPIASINALTKSINAPNTNARRAFTSRANWLLSRRRSNASNYS